MKNEVLINHALQLSSTSTPPKPSPPTSPSPNSSLSKKKVFRHGNSSLNSRLQTALSKLARRLSSSIRSVVCNPTSPYRSKTRYTTLKLRSTISRIQHSSASVLRQNLILSSDYLVYTFEALRILYVLTSVLGYHRHSLAYTSLGPRRHNQPFTPTQYGPPYTTGDVIGVGYRPRTGTIFFTRNGRKLDDVAHGMKTQNFFPTVGANGPCNIHVNFGQSGFVFIEANVKKWGLAPMTGSLAPPPPYGSEAGSILLEQGGGNAQAQRGGGLEGWQHYQQFGQTPQQQQRSGHVRRATPMYRPRAGTGPPMPLAHHPPPNSPGPIRSPTEISLAQLVHVDSNQGYVEDGDSDDEGEEDIGEGTSRNPVNLMDQREVMPIAGIQQRGDDEQQQQYHYQEHPSFQSPQRQEQGQALPIQEQPIQGREVPNDEESPPPEYTSPEGSFRRRRRRRRSDGSESSAESDPDSAEPQQGEHDEQRRRLLRHGGDDDDDDDDGSEAATPPVPSYEAATAGEHYHDISDVRRNSSDGGSEERG